MLYIIMDGWMDGWMDEGVIMSWFVCVSDRERERTMIVILIGMLL
jgi:hypothetical protein